MEPHRLTGKEEGEKQPEPPLSQAAPESLVRAPVLKDLWGHIVLGKYNGCGSFPGIELLENGLKGSTDLIFLSQKVIFISGLQKKHLRMSEPWWGSCPDTAKL